MIPDPADMARSWQEDTEEYWERVAPAALRCAQCQTWTLANRLRHGLCCRCAGEYRLSLTWCEAHGPCEPPARGGCLACKTAGAAADDSSAHRRRTARIIKTSVSNP